MPYPDRLVVGQRELSGNLIIWVPGKLVRKSNQRKLRQRGRGGRPLITKSDAAIQWIDSLLKTLPGWITEQKLGGAGNVLHLDFWCFYRTPKNPSHEPDLSVELQLDGLQKGGAILNDRYVYSYSAKKVMTDGPQGVVVEIRQTHSSNPHLQEGLALLKELAGLTGEQPAQQG